MIVPQDISDRLLAECVGRPLAYHELGRLCDFVGGRTSGTVSGAMGEEWAFELMTRWGLENVHYEEFPLSVWIRGTLHVEALSPASWTLTALSHGNAPSNANVTAPVINVGHGERGDYEALKGFAAGRIALCDEGVVEGHRGLHRSEKLRLAAEFDAAGLMIFSSAPGCLPRTGNCCKHEAPIPSLGISQEDGLRLLRLIRNDLNAVPVVSIRMTNARASGVARNVVGDLTGSDRSHEVVLAGAHLDSWDVSQGATDNGLGTAIVLEMGRALAALPRRPRRTVRFGVWAAEEVGLCGSRFHSELHAADLDDYVAVFNFDMTADPYGYWAPKTKQEAGSADEAIGFKLLADLCEQLEPVGMRKEIRHRAGLHSDHQPFMLEGVQALALLAENRTLGAHYYHSVGDTFDKVSLPAMARAAAVGAHTLWALADSPERPFPRLSVKQLHKLIDEADLYEALVAEGYDGPIMHLAST
jgi:hypothetical protein